MRDLVYRMNNVHGRGAYFIMFTRFRLGRVCLVLLALVALPVLTYWDTIFAHFGLRDDYSVLRESHEEPGKVTAFCASHARPIFGWLLEESFQPLHQIEDLKWGRLLAALCIGLAAAGTTWVLVKQFDWRLGTAACVGALVALLPASQVLVGWAICWGHLVGVIFAIVAFALADRGVLDSTGWTRAGWLLGGWIMLLLAGLTYQSNALFYVVFLAAGLAAQRAWPIRKRIIWIGGHLAMVGAGLVGAFLAAKGLFAVGVFAQSDRIAFDPDIIGKIGWFVRGPLGNALSLLIINDDDGRTFWWHWLAAIVVTLVIIAGLVSEGRRHGRTTCLFWAVGLVGLPLLAYSVSIIASERWSTYRTIYALTGVLLVFFVLGLDHLASRLGRGERWFTPSVLGALVLIGFGLARHQAYDLIAVPQARELRLLTESARFIDPEKNPRVFVVTPDSDDSFAELTYADEFGSLSTASSWTPKEMLKHLMTERFPDVADVNTHYTFDYGNTRPADGAFDVVIDLDKALTTLKERQLGKKGGHHPSAWRYFASRRSFGLEHGLRHWPVLALFGFGIVLLGRRFTDREPDAV